MKHVLRGLTRLRGLGMVAWLALVAVAAWLGAGTARGDLTTNKPAWSTMPGVNTNPPSVSTNPLSGQVPYSYPIVDTNGGLLWPPNFAQKNGLQRTNDVIYTRSYPFANPVAAAYCAKANDTNLASEATIDSFISGLKTLGIDGNLVDFAMFEAPAQNAAGLVTLSNTVSVVGNVQRLPGGVYMPNYFTPSCTNFMFVTNELAGNDHTLLIWFSQPIEGAQNTGVGGASVYSYGDSGLGLYGHFGGDAGGMWPAWYDGTMHSGSRDMSVSGDNRLVCAAQTSGSAMNFWLFRDNLNLPVVADSVGGSLGAYGVPSVLRFGTRWSSATNCWNGLYRGYALFNKVLASNTCWAASRMIPKVGVVIQGDSKSIGAPNAAESYGEMWQQAPAVWGLFSEITNSSVGGTTMRGGFLTRFPIDVVTVGTTNATYPIILNLLRGGQNDLDSFLDVTNALTAATNMITWSHTNHWLVGQLNCDRTATYGLGGSNYFDAFNAVLESPGYPADFVIKAMEFYTNLFGLVPWTNTAIYGDVVLPAGGVHENLSGASLLGTNCVAAVLNATTLPLFPPALWVPRDNYAVTSSGGGNAGAVVLPNAGNLFSGTFFGAAVIGDYSTQAWPVVTGLRVGVLSSNRVLYGYSTTKTNVLLDLR